jgi:glycosyltransferase involved in cell wall biosynthesis
VKILHISTYLGGGAGVAARRLHEGLVSSGVQSNFLYLNSEVAAIIRKKGTYITRLRRKLKVLNKKLPIRFRINLENAGSQIYDGAYEIFTSPFSEYDITLHPSYQEADIIHLHWIANFLDYPSFFSKNKKPIVWTLHDMGPIQGGFHYNEDVAINQHMAEVEEKYRLVKKLAVKESNINVVALSKWLLEESVKSDNLGSFPHHLIPNGLDTGIFKHYNKQFAREVFNLPENKIIVLFVSENLENRRKGFDLLISALNRFKSDNNIVFCAVGNNKSRFESNNIIFLDSIYDERLMAQLYAAADLFVIPSREDNLPNVMLEAMACGTPVVSSPVGGMLDVIVEGINGFIAKEVTSEALFETIERAVITIESIDREQIIQLLKSKYSIDQQVEKYKYLYSKLM